MNLLIVDYALIRTKKGHSIDHISRQPIDTCFVGTSNNRRNEDDSVKYGSRTEFWINIPNYRMKLKRVPN
jgi:hypothetical protein